MKCAACNNDISITYRVVDGSSTPILEDLCSTCLFWVRASMYDSLPDPDRLTDLGVCFDKEDETF